MERSQKADKGNNNRQPVNLMMGLREFTYREQDGTRDIYYKLSFIEYKELNTPSANNDKQTDETTG